MLKKLSRKTNLVLIWIVIGLFVGVSINRAFGGSDPTIVDQRNGNLAVNIANVYQNGLLVPYGNVGIGVVNPAVKLDVNGYVKSTTAFCIGTTCIDENQLKTILGVGGTATTASTTSTTASTHKLPPTGITHYSDRSTNTADASVGADNGAFPRQDARYARPFDYTKIANDGSTLPSTASLGTGPKDWACTKDNITGLIWEVKTTSGLRNKDYTYSWYNSDTESNGGANGSASSGTCQTPGKCDTEKFVDDVKATSLCGQSDWRMPSIKELEGLTNFGQQNPAITTSYFPDSGTTNGGLGFWSGTASGSSGTATAKFYAWMVTTLEGSSTIRIRTSLNRVRLVAGIPPSVAHSVACLPNLLASNPDTAYTVPSTNDGTVIDNRTGLMWKRCSEGQVWENGMCTGTASTNTWGQALTLGRNSTFAGYSDWRLPNVKELRSLVEECRSAPPINETIFPNTTSNVFLSSSPSIPFANLVWPWAVEFSNGITVPWESNNSFPIRLVRDVTTGP